jgi:dTMP kinase
MTGRFITLEGIEGAGKSTVAALVRDRLVARGIKVCLTREPGGTVLAERIRRIVLDREGERIAPVAETLLMFAARSIHLDNQIRPALATGEWVVCDRFTDATRAYQGGGRAVNDQWIEQLATAVHADLQPDCTILLDLPVALGLERARRRSGALPTDRFEEEPARFFERVRATYLALAAADPERIRIVDAAEDLPTVVSQVGAILAPMLDRT